MKEKRQAIIHVLAKVAKEGNYHVADVEKIMSLIDKENEQTTPA